MIKFQDSLGVERAIEFSISFNRRYINLTLFVEKRSNGDTIQIPISRLPDLIDNLTFLAKDNNDKS